MPAHEKDVPTPRFGLVDLKLLANGGLHRSLS